MAFSYGRNQRGYGQVETAYGLVNNTSGASTITGSNCFRSFKWNFVPIVDLLTRDDKTGTRTVTAGTAGKKSGKWEVAADLAANGAAGVVPDIDFLLQAIFGQAATISAGVSATYALSDNVKSFSGFNYRTPSSMVQQIGAGCLVDKATFSLGQNIAQVSASGTCKWVISSAAFSTLDTPGKCGLTSFPTEPGSPVTNGGIIAGFTGQATLDGNVLANIKKLDLSIQPGNKVNLEEFGFYYPQTPLADVRNVGVTFEIFDDDGSSTTNLYNKAESKAPINIVMQIGTIAGSIFTFTIKGVQLQPPALTDGLRWSAAFDESRGTGSSITALDEVALVIT